MREEAQERTKGRRRWVKRGIGKGKRNDPKSAREREKERERGYENRDESRAGVVTTVFTLYLYAGSR